MNFFKIMPILLLSDPVKRYNGIIVYNTVLHFIINIFKFIFRLKQDINNIINVITSYEKQFSVNESSNNKENVVSEGLVLIVPLLTSHLRAMIHCLPKLNALEVLRTIANYLSPDIILDRLLPYLVSIFNYWLDYFFFKYI